MMYVNYVYILSEMFRYRVRFRDYIGYGVKGIKHGRKQDRNEYQVN